MIYYYKQFSYKNRYFKGENFIHKNPSEIAYGSNDAELYFEEDDIDTFIEKLSNFDIEYVHPLKVHSWGQRVIRFYDLDKYIIEVGENMVVVVKRFIDTGMTVEQVAHRMDVSIDYINLLQKQDCQTKFCIT